MNHCREKGRQLRRRHWRVRRKVSGTGERPRLAVYRSLKHIYAQLVDDENATTLMTVSSLSPELREGLKYGGNAAAAAQVGELLAKKAAEKKIVRLVFDRGGRKYHGRVKALAEAARKGGLQF